MPGQYDNERGSEVPVYWDTDLDTPIGKASLYPTAGYLRVRIQFIEMVLPPELMTSIQNNPNSWVIGTVEDKVIYMIARPMHAIQEAARNNGSP
jgi:hypothetical protein